MGDSDILRGGDLVRLNYIDNIDCLEGMKQIPDGSVDMILCDLPYGTTACKWDTIIPFEPLWEQYKRVIKDDGAIVLFGSEPFSTRLRSSNLEMFKYDWYWKKNRPANHINAKRMPMRYIETISVFYKKQPTFRRQRKENPITTTSTTTNTVFGASINGYTRCVEYDAKFDLLEFPKDGSLHPTQKPVALCEYLIKTYTNPGEVVLDNCMGGGTTAVAAIRTGRNFIGFELDEKYHAIAMERVAAEIDNLLEVTP
jgi:site-specific DNA-methyltransferase (adenine-specific)